MLAGISVWQLLIIAMIVVLLFGTKKLRTIGGDLGAAVKGFKKALNDDEPVKSADFSEPAHIDKVNTSFTDSAHQYKEKV